jgi:hypothetical protein
MENVKDWLDKKGYYNSGLRTDRNHRIDLYLSDVLEEYRTDLLRIHSAVEQSEQLKPKEYKPAKIHSGTGRYDPSGREIY